MSLYLRNLYSFLTFGKKTGLAGLLLKVAPRRKRVLILDFLPINICNRFRNAFGGFCGQHNYKAEGAPKGVSPSRSILWVVC